MISELKIWFTTNQEKFQTCQFTVNLYVPTKITEKPGAYIEIMSPNCLARITVWETGECEEEILDIKTGNSVFSKFHQFHSEVEVHECLDEFIKRIGC